MKLVLDANFDATRADTLRRFGMDAIHWSSIGSAMDTDEVIVRWARTHKHVLVTQDIGIASELVRRGDDAPSVIQVRFAIDLGPELMCGSSRWRRGTPKRWSAARSSCSTPGRSGFG